MVCEGVVIDSTYIKACLSAYFRFRRGVKLIATEAGKFNADFLSIDKDKLIEVEIKTSKADLRNDFKKKKHQIYENARSDWTPTYFYFAVPEELVEYAVAKCVDKKYGVLCIKTPGGRKKGKWPISSWQTEEKVQKLIHRRYENPVVLGIVENKWGRSVEYEYDASLSWEERVSVVKQAKALTNRPPPSKVKTTIVARLSSEMANLRIQAELSKKTIPQSGTPDTQ